MPLIDPDRSALLVIDLQARLMPAIDQSDLRLANAARLAGDTALVVCGCEAHVCVLQTVLGLRATGRQVFVVADAVGSRIEANRKAGLARMQAHGAEIVTTEMVIFEWLGSAAHPAFKTLMPLIK